jgi:hypothetical protein
MIESPLFAYAWAWSAAGAVPLSAGRAGSPRVYDFTDAL